MENFPAPSMSTEERSTHLNFMKEALNMANLALTHSETPVGCIFVHNNTVIGRGMNDTNRSFNGTRHAEFIALNDILSQPHPSDPGKRKYDPEIMKECTLYVTVEPCIMCASLLRQVGIKRVFFGAGNEKFGGTGGVLSVHGDGGRVRREGGKEAVGRGIRANRERGRENEDYEVSGGWLREECIVVLRRFYVQENERAPEEKRSKEGRVLRLDVEPLVEGSGSGG